MERKTNGLETAGNLTPLSMVVLPESAWARITDELQELKRMLQQKSDDEVNGQWIDSVEARKILGVSQRTWQTYRDERRIPFVQIGRTIYVKREDLDSYMRTHYISARQ